MTAARALHRRGPAVTINASNAGGYLRHTSTGGDHYGDGLRLPFVIVVASSLIWDG